MTQTSVEISNSQPSILETLSEEFPSLSSEAKAWELQLTKKLVTQLTLSKDTNFSENKDTTFSEDVVNGAMKWNINDLQIILLAIKSKPELQEELNIPDLKDFINFSLAQILKDDSFNQMELDIEDFRISEDDIDKTLENISRIIELQRISNMCPRINELTSDIWVNLPDISTIAQMGFPNEIIKLAKLMIAVYEIGHILDEDASPEKIFKEHSITPQWLQALLEKKEVQEQVTDDQLKLYKRAANDII